MLNCRNCLRHLPCFQSRKSRSNRISALRVTFEFAADGLHHSCGMNLLSRWSVLTASCFFLLFSSCNSNPKNQPALERFEYDQPEMGVPFRIIVYAKNEGEAEHAVNAAFTRIEQLNHILSDYETDSEISELSRTSGKNMEVRLSDDLWDVLSVSQ